MNSEPVHQLDPTLSDALPAFSPVLWQTASPLSAILRPLPSDQHPALVYLASLSPRSRRTMRGDLNTLASLLTSGREDLMILDWAQLRYSHCAALRSALADRYSYTTANRMLSALRGVLKAAWRLGHLPTEEYHRAIDLPSVRGETLPRGRALTTGELRTLFESCHDGRNAGLRDQALLGILYGCGLRRAEAVALNVEDYEKERGELRVLNGKGNKQRLVHLPPGSVIALDRWIEARTLAEVQVGDLGSANAERTSETMLIGESKIEDESEEKGAEITAPYNKDREEAQNEENRSSGPLFLPILKSRKVGGGRIVWRRLTDQSVMDILLRRARLAGLQKVSPHDFRRTFISDLLDAGADIATVQKMAGHANITTTARYDRRGEGAKRKAAQMLHVPITR